MALVIWLLMGFLGAIYWFLPQELEREVEGIALAEILFWVFCAAVAIVVVVFVLVQYGSATESSMWFINQGRKYVEAPRWAAIGIAAVMGVFAYNVIGTAVKARKSTGILSVLIVDLVPLVVLYFDAFPEMRNMSQDLFWWWWLVHLWVEATWEVLIGCIMAWTLIHLVGSVAPRGRELALCRSCVGAWHRHPRVGASLFLDRHAALLVRDRRILFGAGAAATARDGRACGV